MPSKQFLTRCEGCGKTTTKAYAKEHDGFCKQCAEPPEVTQEPTRQQRIIDQGWEGYAREEGHYDQGDN